MTHGGARPGAGRKAGGRNSTPAKGVTGRNVCLPAASWDKLSIIASDRGTTPTKLAASVIIDWLASQ